MKRTAKLLALIFLMTVVLGACSKAEETVTETTEATTEVTTEATTEVTEEVTEEETTEEVTEEETSEEDESAFGHDLMIAGEDNAAGTTGTILYQGHASVRITTAEGKVIYIDPYFGAGYDEAADLILVTHGHSDHSQTSLITKQNDDCQTITYKEALKDGKYETFDLGYVKVEAVKAENSNHSASECVGFILTFSNGVAVYFSGDTSTTDKMSELAERKLDYAFICCDGVYNMDVSEASKCAKLINAKHTIPYHMVPSSNPDGFDPDVADSFDAPDKIIMRPSEELSF